MPSIILQGKVGRTRRNRANGARFFDKTLVEIEDVRSSLNSNSPNFILRKFQLLSELADNLHYQAQLYNHNPLFGNSLIAPSFLVVFSKV